MEFILFEVHSVFLDVENERVDDLELLFLQPRDSICRDVDLIMAHEQLADQPLHILLFQTFHYFHRPIQSPTNPRLLPLPLQRSSLRVQSHLPLLLPVLHKVIHPRLHTDPSLPELRLEHLLVSVPEVYVLVVLNEVLLFLSFGEFLFQSVHKGFVGFEMLGFVLDGGMEGALFGQLVLDESVSDQILNLVCTMFVVQLFADIGSSESLLVIPEFVRIEILLLPLHLSGLQELFGGSALDCLHLLFVQCLMQVFPRDDLGLPRLLLHSFDEISLDVSPAEAVIFVGVVWCSLLAIVNRLM